MKVEELEIYGKALEMPKEAMRKQAKVVFKLLRNEFGIGGIIGFTMGIRKHTKGINKEYPELNTLGCDHFLAAYPLIEGAVQCDFRRPCTLAKGGNYCHFHFYRKGTAPNTAHLNQ